jgi:hypothetical protein
MLKGVEFEKLAPTTPLKLFAAVVAFTATGVVVNCGKN